MVLSKARLIAKDIKVLVPAEGSIVMCPLLEVVAVPELQGYSEAEIYAEVYVGDMLNLEAFMRGNERAGCQ
ncbi:MAG: hypothetical protein ABJ364_08600 [Lentilitoribacter sp.]